MTKEEKHLVGLVKEMYNNLPDHIQDEVFYMISCQFHEKHARLMERNIKKAISNMAAESVHGQKTLDLAKEILYKKTN
jgi:hypothetical protein